jgi:hypothetical protein
MIQANSSDDPISELRALVETLEPTAKDEFSPAKTKPLAKLQTKVGEIESDTNTSEQLKVFAANLNALLTANTGAAARKEQMLALFPAAGDTTTSAEGAK